MRARRRSILIAAAIGVLLFAGCRDHPTNPGEISGLYRYTAFDARDSIVVIGTITLVNRDSTILTGTWGLIAVDTAAEVGPQTGTGTLYGSTAAGVMIDLNPGWADNNVFLDGASVNGAINGTWSWSTFAGVSAEGRFEMKKR